MIAAGVRGPAGSDGQIVRYRNWSSFSPTREIHAGDHVLHLPRRERDFSGLGYTVDGQRLTVDDFMRHNHVAGLLVIDDGDILLERYGLGNDENSRWVSYSMAKSVTSMLMGAAMLDGYIDGVDDRVTDYLPQLRGSSYDQATLRDVLQMASGVQWNEDYVDPESDLARSPSGNLAAMYEYLGNQPQVARPGEVFNYNTAETDLIGAIVRAAIGNNFATYLEHKIWQPFGMESDASWATHGEGGGERGGCCINATLRDYGRIGLFAMHGGVLADGTRVVPEGWMQEATTPSPANDGYGYQWWLNADGTYQAIGIYGQGMYIDSEDDLVIVVLSAWPVPTGREYSAHRTAFFAAVDAALGG
jgi:CubicO group peptidase (beta-lactamase class C family)